jgi:hypothetical protein
VLPLNVVLFASDAMLDADADAAAPSEAMSRMPSVSTPSLLM